MFFAIKKTSKLDDRTFYHTNTNTKTQFNLIKLRRKGIELETTNFTKIYANRDF